MKISSLGNLLKKLQPVSLIRITCIARSWNLWLLKESSVFGHGLIVGGCKMCWYFMVSKIYPFISRKHGKVKRPVVLRALQTSSSWNNRALAIKPYNSTVTPSPTSARFIMFRTFPSNIFLQLVFISPGNDMNCCNCVVVLFSSLACVCFSIIFISPHLRVQCTEYTDNLLGVK